MVPNEIQIKQVSLALEAKPLPAELCTLKVWHDGSYRAVLDNGVCRTFDFNHQNGRLTLIKISVPDANQRCGLATLITLLTVHRLVGQAAVTVTGLQPPGRYFWKSLVDRGLFHVIEPSDVDLSPDGGCRRLDVRITDEGQGYLRSRSLGG